MARLRTHNNRRRAKELKQGGLYVLRLCPIIAEWPEPEQFSDVEELLHYAIGHMMGLPARYISSGPRL